MQFIRTCFCKKIFLIMLQGVDRPNTTPIGQDRKFRDLRVLLWRVHLSKTSLFYLKWGEGFWIFFAVRAGWFCIRCHLFISMFEIRHWWAVFCNKGQFFFVRFFLFCRAAIIWLKLTHIGSCSKGYLANPCVVIFAWIMLCVRQI